MSIDKTVHSFKPKSELKIEELKSIQTRPRRIALAGTARSVDIGKETMCVP